MQKLLSIREFVKTVRGQPIHIRVLISIACGILFSSVFIYPFGRARFHYLVNKSERLLELDNFISLMLSGPELALWAFIFLSPLILITMFLSYIFREFIDNNIAISCLISPILISLFGAVLLSPFANDRGTIIEILVTNDFLLWGPPPCALIFYALSAHRTNRKSNPDEEDHI